MPVFRDERSADYPRFSKKVIESFQRTGLDRVLGTLNLIYGLDPDWAELFTQYVRGALYNRQVISQATREICACAALACIDQQNQLSNHLQHGFAYGATKEELLEAILQSVVYGGFPAALASMRTYAEVFPEMVKQDRPPLPATPCVSPQEPGFHEAPEVSTHLYREEYSRLTHWEPDFAISVQRFILDGLDSRRVLDVKLQQLISVACLTVRNALPQLKINIRVSLNAGLRQVEIQEVIFQMSAYAGFPYMIQALRVLEQVGNAADMDAEVR